MKRGVLELIFGIFLIGLIGVVSAEENCSSNNLSLCLNETNCTDADGYWYSNACHATAQVVCSSNNLSLCLNETSCEAAGGEWEDNACEAEDDEDDDNNETEDDDDNETEDDENGCVNITSKNLCELKKNCDWNNATGKCVKTTKIKRLKATLQAYLNSTECPEDCVCAGSTIKCETED